MCVCSVCVLHVDSVRTYLSHDSSRKLLGNKQPNRTNPISTTQPLAHEVPKCQTLQHRVYISHVRAFRTQSYLFLAGLVFATVLTTYFYWYIFTSLRFFFSGSVQKQRGCFALFFYLFSHVSTKFISLSSMRVHLDFGCEKQRKNWPLSEEKRGNNNPEIKTELYTFFTLFIFSLCFNFMPTFFVFDLNLTPSASGIYVCVCVLSAHAYVFYFHFSSAFIYSVLYISFFSSSFSFCLVFSAVVFHHILFSINI